MEQSSQAGIVLKIGALSLTLKVLALPLSDLILPTNRSKIQVKRGL